MNKEKNLFLTYILWALFGCFGFHRFYLGRPKTAILMLVLSSIAYFSYLLLIGVVLTLVMVVWLLIDAFLIYQIVFEHNEKITINKIKEMKKNQKNFKSNPLNYDEELEL